MATVTVTPRAETRTRRQAAAHALREAGLLLAATFGAFLLLGYHPGAEDGGIYTSALAERLHPDLFPAYRAFAVAHTSESLFLPALEATVRVSHLPEAWVLLILFTLSIAGTLTAAAAVARMLFPDRRWQWPVVVLAAALGLPVAGTSLYLADPYLSARSVSTPLLLWCAAAVLQRRLGRAALLWVAAAAIHPLMAVWAGLLLVNLVAVRSRRSRMLAGGIGSAVLLGMAAMAAYGPAAGASLRNASLSRAYWFLSAWQWYEWIGLLAPAAILLWLSRTQPHRSRAEQDVARAAVLSLATVTCGSLLMIGTGNESFLLARTQPMRLLHTATLLFLLLLAGSMERWLPTKTRHGAMAAIALGAAAGCLLMQRDLYRHSGQWEVPGHASPNGYVQAFLWARDHTPADALFATDSAYTTAPGEDAQMLRPWALRSALPDAAKDGGVSSVVPSLAEAWQRGRDAQAGLNDSPDAERLAKLRPLGATWIVLPSAGQTAFDCPYSNATAKICRLP